MLLNSPGVMVLNIKDCEKRCCNFLLFITVIETSQKKKKTEFKFSRLDLTNITELPLTTQLYNFRMSFMQSPVILMR